LIIASSSLAGAEESATSAEDKIDPALAEIMGQGEGKEIAVIVMLSPGADHDFAGLAEPAGLSVKYRYGLIPGLAGQATGQAISDLARDDRVAGIYFDRSTSLQQSRQAEQAEADENATALPAASTGPENFSLPDGAFASDSPEEYISPARLIGADRLWEKGIDGRGIKVAVIDSGIDKNHPDLVGKVVAEKNFLSDEITADDLLGHGTMVAGIIAGTGAASGGEYKGIAPGADLISVKVIDGQGDGKVSDIIAGIEWAIYSGADVLSLSLGGINLGETNPPITMAADNAAAAGVVVCVAAGNRNNSDTRGTAAKSLAGPSSSSASSNSRDKGESGYMESLARQMDGSGPGETEDDRVRAQQLAGSDQQDVLLLLVPVVVALPPGLIDSPGDGVRVITVGAADSKGRMAGFSGSGPTRDDRIKPDVVAPGVDVISTVPSGLKRPVYVDDYYARESGTSLSTPVVAGLAALLLQAEDNLTSAGVKAAMTRGADKLENSQGEAYEEYYQGAGMIDALASYELLENTSSICGTVPDLWRAGRWAYLPAGKGVYVGVDAGADRPQKKIYALAPGDEDWNLRFVFFSNSSLEGVKTEVVGDVSEWVSLQALPERIAANDQKVFSASLAVPEDALPGLYSGSIRISSGRQVLMEIPVSVDVAAPLHLYSGTANISGAVVGNGWDYYYLETEAGSAEFQAKLNWQGEANLDLFLLSPTSEYYVGAPSNGSSLSDISSHSDASKSSNPTDISNASMHSDVSNASSLSNASNASNTSNVSDGSYGSSGREETGRIKSPPSGRWLIAVHSENATEEVGYRLELEHFKLASEPQRWNLDSVPGSRVQAQFSLLNVGKALENISYSGVIDSSTSEEQEGMVEHKKTWEWAVNASNSTNKLSATLFTDDKTNSSELALVLENPQGDPYDALLGTGDLGPLEASSPESGTWKVKVYGNDVRDDEGQSFRVLLKSYGQNPWSWIETRGPARLESNESATLYANLSIPDTAAQARRDGYIKISSENRRFEIPVSVTVSGASLEGLVRENITDSDGDGLYDRLTLGFGINISADASAPTQYRLRGTLSDCNGSRIESLEKSFSLNRSGMVSLDVSGNDIWRAGQCGPLSVENLILYDLGGTYIDRFEKEIKIDREPEQFQPPDAYLTGEYLNRTDGEFIIIGVNLTVVKPGRYRLEGTIVNDYKEELDSESEEVELSAGNVTVELGFDSEEFVRIDEVSRIHLLDLVLSRDGVELERADYPYVTDEMDPKAFSEPSIRIDPDAVSPSGRPVMRLGGSRGVARVENETAAIS
jgi:subtilisin family serine protease